MKRPRARMPHENPEKRGSCCPHSAYLGGGSRTTEMCIPECPVLEVVSQCKIRTLAVVTGLLSHRKRLLQSNSPSPGLHGRHPVDSRPVICHRGVGSRQGGIKSGMERASLSPAVFQGVDNRIACGGFLFPTPVRRERIENYETDPIWT